MTEKPISSEVLDMDVDDSDCISSSSQLIAKESSQDADKNLGSSKVLQDEVLQIDKLPTMCQLSPIATKPKEVQASNTELTVDDDLLKMSGDLSSEINVVSQIVSAKDLDAGTKTISSKPLEDEIPMFENHNSLQKQDPPRVPKEDRQTENFSFGFDDVFINEQSSNHLNPEIKHIFPENVLYRTQNLEVLSLNPMGDNSTSVENMCCIETQVPFMTNAKDVPTYDTAMDTDLNSDKENELPFRPFNDNSFDNFPSTIQNISKQFNNQCSLSIQNENYEKTIGSDFDRQNVYLQKDDRTLSTGHEDEFIESDILSIGNFKEQHTTDKNQLDITHQFSTCRRSLPEVQNKDDVFQKDEKFACKLKDQFHGNNHSSNTIIRDQFIRNTTDDNTQYLRRGDINTSGHQTNNGTNRLENGFSEFTSSSNINCQVITERNETDIDIQDIETVEANIKFERKIEFTHKTQTLLPNSEMIKISENFRSNKDQHTPITTSNGITTSNSILHLEESEGDKTHAQNIDSQNFLIDNLAPNYRNLYVVTLPENYDFAMNIMAYVEFLNDSSWKASESYFNEVVKATIRDIWNENIDFFKSKFELQTADHYTIEELMSIFTNRILDEDYDVGKFLNYCVLMCQLGVLARQRDLKEAPLLVISILRSGILHFEQSQQVVFEFDVQNHAQNRIS